MSMARLIPAAAMEKLLKNAGAQRVSEEAKVALKNILEKEAEKIAKQAIITAKHAGRKTIKGSDITSAHSN